MPGQSLIPTVWQVLLLLWQLLPSPVQPRIDRFVPGDKAEDPALAEILQGYLAGHASAGHTYYYNRVDLNGDGRDELLACLVGPDACGAGGCPVFVLSADESGYKPISAISGCAAPVVVSSRKSNGWSDLLVWQRGLALPGIPRWDNHYVRLAFDGNSYPSSAAGGERLNDPVTGTAYMTDYDGVRGGHRLILEVAVTASRP